MTLEKAYIQLSKSFFASGQAYVALSRVKDINNLHLLQYDPSAIHIDPYYKQLLTWMENNNALTRDDAAWGTMPYPCKPNQEKYSKKGSPHANNSKSRKRKNTNKDNDVCSPPSKKTNDVRKSQCTKNNKTTCTRIEGRTIPVSLVSSREEISSNHTPLKTSLTHSKL